MIHWFLRQFPSVRALEAARDEKIQQQGTIQELRHQIEALHRRIEISEDRAFRAMREYADRLFELQTGHAPGAAPVVAPPAGEKSGYIHAVSPQVISRSYENPKYMRDLEEQQTEELLRLQREILEETG